MITKIWCAISLHIMYAIFNKKHTNTTIAHSIKKIVFQYAKYHKVSEIVIPD